MGVKILIESLSFLKPQKPVNSKIIEKLKNKKDGIAKRIVSLIKKIMDLTLQITHKIIFIKNKNTYKLLIMDVNAMKNVPFLLRKTQILVSPIKKILENPCHNLKVCPMNFNKLRTSNSISQNIQLSSTKSLHFMKSIIAKELYKGSIKDYPCMKANKLKKQ